MNIKNLKIGFYIAIAFIPMMLGFGSISSLLLPVVLLYFYVRQGAKWWAAGSAAAFLLTFFIGGLNILQAVIFTVPAFCVSFFLGQGIRKLRAFSMTLISACVAHLTVTAGILMYYMQVYKKSAFDLLAGEAVGAINAALINGGVSAGALDATEIMRQLELMLPSILILSSCLSVYLIFAITRTWLHKKGFPVENMPYFYEFRLGSGFTTVFLIILMAAMFTGFTIMSMNIMIVVTALFTVCGLSVCDYHLRRHNIGAVLRGLIYMAAVVLFVTAGYLGLFLLVSLFALGVFDSYRSMRSQKDVL